MLPNHDPLVDEYRYVLRKFRQIDRVYLDVGVNTDDPDKLAAAADEVFSALSTNAAYVRIMYRFEVGGQQKVIDYLTGALPNLFTDADAQTLALKLEPAAVREYLTVMRRKLAGPEGMVLKNVVAADPVGMSALVLNKVMPLQTGFGDTQIVDGRITSGDGRHVLLMAEPIFRSSNSHDSEALVKDLLRTAREVEGRFPGVHVAITGGHRMTVDNATIIKGAASSSARRPCCSCVFRPSADAGWRWWRSCPPFSARSSPAWCWRSAGVTSLPSRRVLRPSPSASPWITRSTSSITSTTPPVSTVCPWAGISGGWCCRSASAR
jgi:hypothetical protein